MILPSGVLFFSSVKDRESRPGVRSPKSGGHEEGSENPDALAVVIFNPKDSLPLTFDMSKTVPNYINSSAREMHKETTLVHWFIIDLFDIPGTSSVSLSLSTPKLHFGRLILISLIVFDNPSEFVKRLQRLVLPKSLLHFEAAGTSKSPDAVSGCCVWCIPRDWKSLDLLDEAISPKPYHQKENVVKINT